MPKTTVAPITWDNARHSRFASTGGTGGAIMHDGLDTTYIRRMSAGSPGIYYHLADPSVPAGSDVATIVPCARVKQPTGTAPKILSLNLYGFKAGGIYCAGPKVGFPGVFSSPANVAAAASAGAALAPIGTGWVAAAAAGLLGIAVDDGHAYTDSNRDYIYELSADVYYAARPTASVTTTPSSPISTTSFPVFNVSVSALIEAWQDNVGAATMTDCAWELKVFTAAQVAAGGFDAAVTVPYWSAVGTAPLDYIDGSTPSTAAPSVACDSVLANGSYYAYVRATRAFAGALAGAWTSLAVTVAITLPTAPTISAAADGANQRVAVTVTPNASSGATGPLVSLQRTSDGGATWQAVHGATSVPGTFGTPIAFYDYTAPRGVALTYRVQVTATVSSQQLATVWASAAVAGTLAGAGWNLKVPDAPAMNMLGALIAKDPEFTQTEEVVEFNVVGRTYPVVVSMALNGIDGAFDMQTRTEAEWTLLQALMAYRGALFLESPFGWGRWIRIMVPGGGRSAARKWAETGPAGDARRRVHLDCREVGEP
jgi:hypothetical protein